jgi:hypothetical protein
MLADPVVFPAPMRALLQSVQSRYVQQTASARFDRWCHPGKPADAVLVAVRA